MMKKHPSRKIPAKISKEVRERHFFQCAWCNEALYDYHHIHEFSKGGDHTPENLILLCPNCHRQLHRGEIPIDDLIIRKSTHLKDDRINGGIRFDLKKLEVKIGGCTFINTPIIFQYNGDPILSLFNKDGIYYLNTRFYNESGELIFWMSKNRWWCKSDQFSINLEPRSIEIVDKLGDFNLLKIWQDNDCIYISGRNFLAGFVYEYGPDYLNTPGFKMENCRIESWAYAHELFIDWDSFKMD